MRGLGGSIRGRGNRQRLEAVDVRKESRKWTTARQVGTLRNKLKESRKRGWIVAESEETGFEEII
jgi:hypothetical protein